MNETTEPQGVPSTVECRAAKDPAVRMLILAAMLLGFGGWCFVDGYVRHLPEKLANINDLATWCLNYVGGVLFPLAGLIVGARMVVFLRRKLLADEKGIGYAGKEKVPWDAFTGMDSSKFKKKGILRLQYASGGTEKVLVLDNWKLDNFRELLQLVETKVRFAIPE